MILRSQKQTSPPLILIIEECTKKKALKKKEPEKNLHCIKTTI